MNDLSKIKELENQIKELKIQTHQAYLTDPRDIEIKFFEWADSGCQTFTQSWIVHIRSNSKTDLIEKYNNTYWVERHQTVDIKMLTEWFYKLLGKGYPIGNGLYEEDGEDTLEENNLTREDVRDWMTELLKMNFLSFKYDW